jgi:signal transduction histidine kinase
VTVAPVHGPLVRPVVTWGAVLLVYAAWRTVRPLDLQPPESRTPAQLAAATLPYLCEAALSLLAIVGTGHWQSPFMFCALTGVMAAGFSRGYAFAVRLALGISATVAISAYLTGVADEQRLQSTGQWVLELLLVAVLAGYARRLFGQAQQRQSETLDRMAELAEANELLVNLYRVAQQLPASLNLDTVLFSTVARLRSIIESDVAAVLVRDDVSARWVVVAGEGTRVGRSFADHELPPALAGTTASSVSSLVVCLGPGEGLGPDLLSHTGLYAPLRARGTLLGLVALEHHAPGSYGRQELQLLDRFVEPAALAIDNARWFARLRAIGADEERVRIARDMHDRIGQSLAGIGFALDLVRRQVPDEALRAELDGLRSQVRSAVTEVRETLGDLRTEITDERGLIETMTSYLERVENRTGIEVNFNHCNGTRLPLLQEREVWRIAQEAITNVERHAEASHLSVRWECDGQEAFLTIADDGHGFLPGRAGRVDSFGITGMRERADAIGASLEIDSAPGAGTMVTCRLTAGRRRSGSAPAAVAPAEVAG